MNYYKDKETGDVFAYTDEQVAEGWVREGLSKMTKAQVREVLEPKETNRELEAKVKTKRRELFQEIEWRVLRYERQVSGKIETNDSPEWYADALVYMQKLRDIPSQKGYPVEVVWPTLEG